MDTKTQDTKFYEMQLKQYLEEMYSSKHLY